MDEMLVHCPFCSGEEININSCDNQNWLSCELCGGEAGKAQTIKEAISKWNKRPRRHMNSEIGLSSCPFCGGKIIKLHTDEDQCWYECTKCGAKGAMSEDEKIARIYWNDIRKAYDSMFKGGKFNPNPAMSALLK